MQFDKSRRPLGLIPATFAGEWDDSGWEYGDIQFYDVHWTEDFGPFKKGDICNCVAILHNPHIIVEFLQDGVRGRSCEYMLMPK